MDFWNYFIENTLPEIRVGVIIFIPTMASVYLSGKMLNILKTYTQKNILATITAYSLTLLYINIYMPEITSLKEIIWMVIYKGSIAILMYVLIGFRLYERADSLLDKKISKD